MKTQIEILKLNRFDKFYKKAKELVVKQYKDYPLWVRKYYWKIHFDPEKLKTGIKDGAKIILLALVDNKIVGFFLLSIGKLGDTDLMWLIIDSEYRRKGLGTKLLEEAEKIALDNKSHFMFLYTENKANIEFYKKRGFYLVGQHKKAWLGQDEYIMQKNIAKPNLKKFKEKASEDFHK